MASNTKITNRTISALILAVALISLVVGLLVYDSTDMGISIIIWIVLMTTGASIALFSPFRTGLSKKFGPSDFDYYLVYGILILVIGLVGYVYTFTHLGWLAPVAIVILTVAILGIIMALKNN